MGTNEEMFAEFLGCFLLAFLGNMAVGVRSRLVVFSLSLLTANRNTHVEIDVPEDGFSSRRCSTNRLALTKNLDHSH